MFSLSELAPLLPEIFVLSAACLLLLLDLFISDARRGLTHFLSLLVLVAAVILTLRGGVATGESVTAFNGMFVRDGVADLLKVFIFVVTAAAYVYAKPYLADRSLFKGEFYVLSLFAVLGMMILVSAGSLITVYLGLELLALSSYALVALDRDNRNSVESAMKYFVLGALASGDVAIRHVDAVRRERLARSADHCNRVGARGRDSDSTACRYGVCRRRYRIQVWRRALSYVAARRLSRRSDCGDGVHWISSETSCVWYGVSSAGWWLVGVGGRLAAIHGMAGGRVTCRWQHRCHCADQPQENACLFNDFTCGLPVFGFECGDWSRSGCRTVLRG